MHVWALRRLKFVTLTSPERKNALIFHCSCRTIYNTLVRLRKRTLFKHFSLILNKELDSLNWSRSGLRYGGCNTREHEVLSESKLFSSHDYRYCRTDGSKRNWNRYIQNQFRFCNVKATILSQIILNAQSDRNYGSLELPGDLLDEKLRLIFQNAGKDKQTR